MSEKSLQGPQASRPALVLPSAGPHGDTSTPPPFRVAIRVRGGHARRQGTPVRCPAPHPHPQYRGSPCGRLLAEVFREPDMTIRCPRCGHDVEITTEMT